MDDASMKTGECEAFPTVWALCKVKDHLWHNGWSGFGCCTNLSKSFRSLSRHQLKYFVACMLGFIVKSWHIWMILVQVIHRTKIVGKAWARFIEKSAGRIKKPNNQKLQLTGTADSFRLILARWKVLFFVSVSSDAVPAAELIVSRINNFYRFWFQNDYL